MVVVLHKNSLYIAGNHETFGTNAELETKCTLDSYLLLEYGASNFFFAWHSIICAIKCFIASSQIKMDITVPESMTK